MAKLLTTLVLLGSLAAGRAATGIDAANRYAYGSDTGWIDWRGDTNSGAVIGDYVCSGYLYAANFGWINLGSGSPTNGIRYQNLSANDFGVNHDGLGHLRGCAYAANLGWINFEDTGTPTVDLKTGNLTGSVYSANAGWISLSNAVAYVQTDSISSGVLDTNGLPIAWELTYFGTLGVNPNADPDGDGMSNLQEYLAGTNPNDPNDKLQITAATFAPGGTSAMLTWKSAITRYYYLQKAVDATAPVWLDSGLGLISPDGTTTTRETGDTGTPMRFFRIRAVRPLP